VPAVPGSKHRILTYDPQTKAVVWEDEPVKANDPVPVF